MPAPTHNVDEIGPADYNTELTLSRWLRFPTYSTQFQLLNHLDSLLSSRFPYIEKIPLSI